MAAAKDRREREVDPSELGKYRGEFVAELDGRSLAHGKDPLKVLEEGKAKAKGREPLIYRVPTGEVMIL